MTDQFDAEQILDLALLPIYRVNGVGQRSYLRVVFRDRHADEDETVDLVERIKVVNEKDPFFSASIFGENAGQTSLMLFLESGAERARQFQRDIQIQFVGSGGFRPFYLLAEALTQFVKDRF